jgi:hypothetical protein
MIYAVIAVFRRYIMLLQHHRIAHAALACAYAAMTIILAIEAAYAHAVCASVVALVYGALGWPQGERGEGAGSAGPAVPRGE